MSKQYLEYAKKKLLNQSPEDLVHLFRRLLADISMGAFNTLKVSPSFQALKKIAVSKLALSHIVDIAFVAINRNAVFILQYLIEECEHKEWLKWKDPKENSFLHLACVLKHTEVVAYLLSQNVDTNAQNINGDTPLHVIARESGHTALITLFKPYAINANIRNNERKAPIHIAALCNNIRGIIELKKIGANVSLEYNNMNYKELSRGIKEGWLKPTHFDEKLLTRFINFPPSDIIYNQYLIGLIENKYNQQQFQIIVKMIDAQTTLRTTEAIVLVDSYLIGYSENPTTLLKFLGKILSSKKSSAPNIFVAITRVCDYFIKNSEFQSVLQLVKFLLTILENDDYPINTPDQSKSFHYSQLADIVKYAKDCQYSFHILGLAIKALTDSDKAGFKALLYCRYATDYVKTKGKHTKKVLSLYQKAFSISESDITVFRYYVHELIFIKEYEQALQICEKALSIPLSKVVRLQVLYLLGKIDASEFLCSLPNEQTDPYTYIYTLTLKVKLHLQNGDHQKAMVLSREAFHFCQTHYQDGEQLGVSATISTILFVHSFSGSIAEGLDFLTRSKKEYPIATSSDFFVNFASMLLYLQNNDIDQAESLLNISENVSSDKRVLLQLTMILVIYLLNLNEDRHYQRALRHLDRCVEIDPTYEKTYFYRALIFALLKNDLGYQQAISHLDPETLSNQLLEKSLARFPEYNYINASHIDSIKIHQYFQSQKKQSISAMGRTMCFETKSTWCVNKVIFSEDKAVSLQSSFYDNYFAIISPDLKLDPISHARFAQALSKGLSKKEFNQNGIKFLDNKIIELKIDGDSRLYTTVIYNNKDGKHLILFDQVGNHQSIRKMLRILPSIQIVNDSEDIKNTPQTKFFKSTSTQDDSQASWVNETTSESLHRYNINQ